MSSFTREFAELTMTQNYVMAGSILFTLSVVACWYILPRLVPNKALLPARVGYVIMCAGIYLVMIVWFAFMAAVSR
jgi:hypothetical protein